MHTTFWSRLTGFYSLSLGQRRDHLLSLPLQLSEDDFLNLDWGLSNDQADLMSENVIGSFSLPFSLASNFIVNDKPVLIPMVTEEPSIVAAASKMAKMVSIAGGFKANSATPHIKGQLQLYGFLDIDKQKSIFQANGEKLLNTLNQKCESMVKRGGGVLRIDLREVFNKKIGPMLIIEPVVNVKDAMGANLVNTLMEYLAQEAKNIFEANVGIAILSNYCDERIAKASCKIPFIDLSEHNGLNVAKKMLAAHALAEVDIYRAATHNKGIMNGIDSVAIATGNDFRALEAAALAYAYAKKDESMVLTNLSIDENEGYLHAEITLPLAVGVVGGSCKFHNGVQFAHKILGEFSKSSENLSMVMASVGLAQCLAALYALCTDGIQKGHMKLHEKKAGLKNGG